jgi:hypothetical protein
MRNAGFEVNRVTLRAAVHLRFAPILRHGLAYRKVRIRDVARPELDQTIPASKAR